MRKRVNECSIALHALTFVRAVGIIPLGVDNRRHWMLDVIFHEGFARFGTGDAAKHGSYPPHRAQSALTRKANDQHKEPPQNAAATSGATS
jgi:hypothetical protein